MVVVRLQRLGTNKVPHHRVVVMDRRRPQGGRVLESIGYYDPSTDPAKFEMDEARFVYWISLGAQVSPALGRLVKRFKKVSVASVRNS